LNEKIHNELIASSEWKKNYNDQSNKTKMAMYFLPKLFFFAQKINGKQVQVG
jgi:hypothetical protein